MRITCAATISAIRTIFLVLRLLNRRRFRLSVAMLRPLVDRPLRCRSIGVWQVRLRCHGLHSLTQFEARPRSRQADFALQRSHTSMVHYLHTKLKFRLTSGRNPPAGIQMCLGCKAGRTALIFTALMLALFAVTVVAQTASPPSPTSQSQLPAVSSPTAPVHTGGDAKPDVTVPNSEQSHYKISPGDTLDITVFGAP